MKLGIVGGLSPESTVTYYLYITRKFSEMFGGSTMPEIIIYSVNLEQYHRLRNLGRWDLIVDELVKSVEYLERCEVDFALIATNTMHKVFDEVQARCSIKLLSILDTTISELVKGGFSKVGLLGTRFTMTDSFFVRRLEKDGISVYLPQGNEIETVHSIIEEELVKGVFSEDSRQEYLKIINGMIVAGAEAVILGCTEIPLLIRQTDVRVPVLDTATIHAKAALDILAGKNTINS